MQRVFSLITVYCSLFTEKSPLPEKNQKRKVSREYFPATFRWIMIKAEL
jgi:hypothetical protein